MVYFLFFIYVQVPDMGEARLFFGLSMNSGCLFTCVSSRWVFLW